MNNVTIVIPVYKDWTTLDICIASLKEHLSPKHSVLILNDMSPEWELMERNILNAIKGRNNFRYEKNEQNMGFVKTCNRALQLANPDTDIFLLNSDTQVTEGFLEEMQEVLYENERHGAVCPRSSNATLLTVPVRKNTTADFSAEASHAIYQQIRPLLPRRTIIPTGVGFAMLIKRDVLNRFGLFDEVYSPGYNEENDFCMRINQYGYSIVMANHAYVYHFESKSFEGQRPKLDLEHSAILKKRYPHYSYLVDTYMREKLHPVDYFADLIADGLYEKKRILFSLYELPAAFNGTAKYSISIYEAFLQLFKDKYDIFLLVNNEADRFHGLSGRFSNVYHPSDITGTFHVAFSPSQIYNVEHMFILSRTCLKYIFCMQDIISVRSSYLLVRDVERETVFRESIHYCDMMTSISRFSLQDTIAYYRNEFDIRNIPTQVIYHGTDKLYEAEAAPPVQLPFDRYFVVFGNSYKHKFIFPLLETLSGSKYKIIVIGSSSEGLQKENIYGYVSGGLSDDFIDYVLGHSIGIIFPSIYEGFGLPFLDGMSYRKHIIVNNTELNLELKDYFDNFKDNVHIFNSLDEIEAILDTVSSDPGIHYHDPSLPIRSWKDSAAELEQCIAQVLKAPVNPELLNERWQHYHYLSNIHRCYVAVDSPAASKAARKQQRLQRLIDTHPKLYKMYRKIIVKLDPDHYK